MKTIYKTNTNKKALIMSLLLLLSIAINVKGQNTKSTYFGCYTLESNTTGTNNSAFGVESLRFNTAGSNNTANGVSALLTNTTGSNNTALGFGADVSTGDLTNTTAIGYNAKATASNTVTIGNTSVTDNYFSGNLRGNAFIKLGGTSSQFLMADGSVSTGGGISAWGTITGTLSSQTDLQNALNVKANLTSPSFTGVPTAPTAPVGTNTNQIATTAFVLANSENENVIEHLKYDTTNKTVWNNGNGNASGNTSYGEIALVSNTTGNYNTANGFGALKSNTTGNANTANGYVVLTLNTTGNFNTANGQRALYSNTTGNANTASGVNALFFNTTGSNNTANGVNALYSNTTGSSNTANGFNALYSNTIGNFNVANGYNALYFNSAGNYNTANGYRSLRSNTTGNGNTVNGFSALYSNTTGSFNIANGYNALYSNTTGSNNTANGRDALRLNITGSNNTALGSFTNVSTGNLNNTTVIGYGTTATANNTVYIGNNQVEKICGKVGWSQLSDGRFKDNVKEDVPGLSFITKLRPVTYNVNTKKLDQNTMRNLPDSIRRQIMQESEAYRIADAKKETGFVAQEVEVAAQELGYDFDGVNAPENETDYYSLTYSEFVVPLVKAVQEQQQQIEQQQQQIDELKKIVSKLTGTIDPSENNDSIIIYPNPSKGVFNITTKGMLISKVEVCNLLGNSLKTIDTINNTSYSLDLSGYPSGVYVLKISSKESVTVKKLIIE